MTAVYWLASGGLALMALLGAPLFAVILAVAMLGFASQGIDLSVIAIEIYRIADTPVLVALPLFTVAGYLLGESNTSSRLVRLTNAFLGWMPGGLAVVAFVACAFFTAFTGASGVTIVALGALLLPALQESGYTDRFSMGLVTSSGSLGLLLPPSLPLILYGIVAQQMEAGDVLAITDLFIAGILPALLMVILLSLYSLKAGRKMDPIDVGTIAGRAGANGSASSAPVIKSMTAPPAAFSVKEALSAMREAIWEIPLPFFILGGIYSGFLAVSEAAAATALYVLVVEMLIYREISIRQLPGILREAAVMVGGILLILGVSLASTNFLIDAEVPMKLFAFIQAKVSSKFTFLILLNIFLLILGAILDIFSAIVIMVPLILPMAANYGIHPAHLGIIFLANMQIGYLTPPVGMNLFIASYRFNRPVTELYQAALPFMAVLLLAVLLITYVPWLSLVFL